MTPTNTQKAGPLHQEIERCAYFLYEKRGCQSGHELEDWLEAEKRLMESPLEISQLNESKLGKAAASPEDVKPAKPPTRRPTESRRREPVLQ